MKTKDLPAAKARTGTRPHKKPKQARKVSARKRGVTAGGRKKSEVRREKKAKKKMEPFERVLKAAKKRAVALKKVKAVPVAGPEVALEDGQQERFCRQMALGAYSNYSCYMQCYPDSSIEAARSHASRLVANGNIRARIDWIREDSLKEVKIRIEEQLRWYLTVKDTPTGYVDAESPLCQEVNYDPQTGAVSKIKIPSKMDAAKQIDKLLGFEKPQEVNLNLPYEPPSKAIERLSSRGIDLAAILAKAVNKKS